MVQDYPWLKSYPEDVDWHEAFISKPLYALLDDTCAKYKKRVAIDFLGKTTTYEELKDKVDRAATGLQKLGVKKGTHVGIFLPNCPQFIISYFAILKAGGTVVNFSPLYSQSELEHQVIDSNIEIMITLNLKILYPKAEKLLGKGKLKHLIISTLPEVLPAPQNILFALFKRKELAPITSNEHTGFITLFDHDPIKNIPDTDAQNDVAVIQYTGGTTGRPKGAMLSHNNVLINATQCSRWCSVDESGTGIMLAALPFFHVFAMTTCMNMALVEGMTILLLPRFDLEQVLKTIDKKRPTIVPGVPTMFNALSNYEHIKKYDLTSIKACVSGGAGLPLDVKKQFEAISGATVIEGYGLTETSPVTNCNPFDGTNKAGSIGLPFPNTIIEIEDMENRGQFLGADQVGELCVRGPQVMIGYYNNEDETNMVIETLDNGERRLRTGDIAKMDEDGYFFIVDRLKEMIISSGFNVYPRNIEEAIQTHPDVIENAVIGIPDSNIGERIKAFVCMKPSGKLTAEMLHNYLKERIGKHEMPHEIEFVDELPKTMIGKISKKDLKP